MLNEFVLITAVCLAIVGALTLFFKEVRAIQKYAINASNLHSLVVAAANPCSTNGGCR